MVEMPEENLENGLGDTAGLRTAGGGQIVRLTNRQKVAVLLAQLGTDRAAPILKEMSDAEAIALIKEIIALPKMNSETVVDVFAEFMERVGNIGMLGQGGPELAKEYLIERLGQARAQEIMDQIEGEQAAIPLTSFLSVDPQQAISVLGAQQPQVVAVVLAYLPPADAAKLLGALEPAFRVKVSKRIAQLTRVDPSAVKQATSLLVGRLQGVRGSGSTLAAGGAAAMAEILNHSERAIEQQVLKDIESDDRPLAEQIRSKLFTFEDLMNLEDKALQQIFRKVDAQTIALAMKDPDISEEIIGKIRSNLSERITSMVEEEVEVMGAVRSSQINSAQATIVRTARDLDAEGVIVIARDDEVVV